MTVSNEQPAWLPAKPTETAPGALAAGATAETRAYAEWFAWASQFYPDDRVAHAAAAAALAALRSGAPGPAAQAAGQQAALAPDVLARPLAADTGTLAYAAWYAWAQLRMKLDPQRSHAAAAAASRAQASGMPITAAQAEGLHAAGVDPASIGPLLSAPRRAGSRFDLGDPAVRAILFGIAALVVPFVFHFYFILLPVLGLVYSVRALTQSRLSLGIPGVVLNGLASLLTALLLFHVF